MVRQARNVIVVVAFISTACTKEKEAPAPAPPPKAQADAPAAATGPKVEAEQYVVELEPSSAGYKSGTDSSVVLSIAARAGYHVNPDFPMAFKPDAVDALKFPAPRISLTEKIVQKPCTEKPEDHCEVHAKVPFTPVQAGAASVSGVAHFSVCSADKCLVEKVPLKIALQVEQ